MKKLIITSFLTLAGGVAFGQIDTNDASLRLWLKADTLSGTEVSLWADSSTNGIRLAVPLEGAAAGEAAIDPTNHTPRLITASNAGKTFNVVQFRQQFDACYSPGHLADRLWQTNKLGAGDPTAIGETNDLTIFVVFKNNNTRTVAFGPAQTIVAKRGPGACPYSLDFGPAPSPWSFQNEHFFVDYAGNVVNGSGLTNVPSAWGLVGVNVTAGGTMTFREFYASLGGWRQSVTSGVGRAPDGTAPESTAVWSADGTPFEIGFHSQGIGQDVDCPFGNGANERFGGEMGEVILFARSLSSNELASVEKYLVDKYLVNTNGPALISAARGVVNPNQVTVEFAETVTAPSATNPANYSIDNGVSVTAASVADGSSRVVLTASALSLGTSYTLTVTNVQNLGGYALPVNSQTTVVMPPPPRVQSSGPDGLLVLEAEHFDANVSAGDISWILTDTTIGFGGETTAFSGDGAMVAAPNIGVNLANNFSVGPHLDFGVRFLTAGTHYLWVRGLGDSAPGPSANDALFVGLNGNVVISGGRITGFPEGSGYVWSQSSGTPPALLVVPNAGDHLLSVWMREDGFIVDKILITTNPSYTPSDIDASESPRAPGVITVSRAGGDIVINWASGILQSADQITGPWTDVVGATSPLTITPTGPAKFYRTRQ